jgi:hypothetical protein
MLVVTRVRYCVSYSQKTFFFDSQKTDLVWWATERPGMLYWLGLCPVLGFSLDLACCTDLHAVAPREVTTVSPPRTRRFHARETISMGLRLTASLLHLILWYCFYQIQSLLDPHFLWARSNLLPYISVGRENRYNCISLSNLKDNNFLADFSQTCRHLLPCYLRIFRTQYVADMMSDKT